MEIKMTDKQDRRSQRTHQALGDALVELMMERGYEAITIKDIIDRANVGRSTFYLHYADKDELFARQMDRVVEMLSQHIPPDTSGNNPFFPAWDCSSVQQQWKLYKILAWEPGLIRVTRYFTEALSEKIEQSLLASGQAFEVPVPVIAFSSGSFLSLLKWWLDNKMVYAPEQMDAMFRNWHWPGSR
jgi:AcrR family transcriptional regulator